MESYNSRYTGKEIEDTLDSLVTKTETILDLRNLQKQFFNKAPSVTKIKESQESVNFFSEFINENNTQQSDSFLNAIASLNIDWTIIDKLIITVTFSNSLSPEIFNNLTLDIVLTSVNNFETIYFDTLGNIVSQQKMYRFKFYWHTTIYSLDVTLIKGNNLTIQCMRYYE